MVDRAKRNTIKKLGLGGLALIAGYTGSNLYGHSDDRIEPGTLEASIEERTRKGGNLMGERDWGNTHVNVPRITATVTETGRRERGAMLYEAVLNAPLDAPLAIADFDGDIPRENVLADRLQADALLCFESLYNVAGGKNVHDRKPHEDAVERYQVRFDDPTGHAGFVIPAGEAYELATGTVLDTYEANDWDLEKESFLQTYMTRFDVHTRDDG